MKKYELLFKESYYDEIMQDNSEFASKTRKIKKKSYEKEEAYQKFLCDTDTAKRLAKELLFNVEIGVYDSCVGYICFRTHRFVFWGGSEESSSFISLIANADEYTFRVSSAYKNPLSEIRLWYDLGE